MENNEILVKITKIGKNIVYEIRQFVGEAIRGQHTRILPYIYWYPGRKVEYTKAYSGP